MHEAVGIEGGWDSFVVEVNGEWIFRFPRDAGAEEVLRKEVALLPALARALPVAVPEPEHFVDGPDVFAGYRKVDGLPFSAVAEAGRTAAAAGASFAAFLRALHAFPLDAARAAGLPPATRETWRDAQAQLCADFETRVVPLLPRERAGQGVALLRSFLEDDASFAFSPALVHYDLGPTHLFFASDGRLTGVIDWSDATIGDPAVDFAWALNATPHAFRAPLISGYAGAEDPGFAARAAFYHRIGPWHEVVYGLETGDDGWVATGLAGVLDRLPRP